MSVKNLMLQPLPATARQIKAALSTRLWIKPGYRIHNVRPNAPEIRTFTRLRPDGFLARFSSAMPPGWLQPVGPAPEDADSGRLYRFVPAD